MSRLSKRKGFATFLDAVDGYDWDDDVRFLVGGAGDMQGALELIIKRSRNNIKYLGEVESREVPALFHDAQILCVPAESQGFGRVYVEALAAGMVVVATNIPPTVETFKDFKNMILVERTKEQTVEGIKGQ